MVNALDQSIWQNAQNNKNGMNLFTPGIQGAQRSLAYTWSQDPGQNFAANYYGQRLNSAQFDQNQQSNNTQQTAMDVANKSSGYIPTDQYGVVHPANTPDASTFSNPFLQQASATTQVGSTEADAAQARTQWQNLNNAQNLLASYNVSTNGVADTSKLGNNTGTPNPATGISGNQTKGEQAVAIAMQAYNNHTPYVWGGNSLTKGLDCSGLVQQVYGQLGVSVPRTTYEQAKSGSIINLKSLLPGDLVFYNTGSSDPNGVGQYSHVAIYTGNGQVVNARNSKVGMSVSSMYDLGTPVLGVRPW